MNSASPHTILVLNGPNLNLLGTREPETYGSTTLAELESNINAHASKHGMAIDFRQTNQEGTLVDWIQEAPKGTSGIILNAAAYTHSSIAIRDAISSISTPVIEVHISNVYAREDFRHHSFISDVAEGVIIGLGIQGYMLAVDAFASKLHDQS